MLDALMSHPHEQKLTHKRMKVEELFAPNIEPSLVEYLRSTEED